MALPCEDVQLCGKERFDQWLAAQAQEFKTGSAEKVLAGLQQLHTSLHQAGHPEAVEVVDKSLYYLRQRQKMMRYAHFRAQGYPIGSGSVESANKVVVQSRMKLAGMRLVAEPCQFDAGDAQSGL